jgi:hypothetical protein
MACCWLTNVKNFSHLWVIIFGTPEDSVIPTRLPPFQNMLLPPPPRLGPIIPPPCLSTPFSATHVLVTGIRDSNRSLLQICNSWFSIPGQKCTVSIIAIKLASSFLRCHSSDYSITLVVVPNRKHLSVASLAPMFPFGPRYSPFQPPFGPPPCFEAPLRVSCLTPSWPSKLWPGCRGARICTWWMTQ